MYPKRETKIESTPGPGVYDPQWREESGFKIGERRYQKFEGDQPGPGQYDQ